MCGAVRVPRKFFFFFLKDDDWDFRKRGRGSLTLCSLKAETVLFALVVTLSKLIMTIVIWFILHCRENKSLFYWWYAITWRWIKNCGCWKSWNHFSWYFILLCNILEPDNPQKWWIHCSDWPGLHLSCRYLFKDAARIHFLLKNHKAWIQRQWQNVYQPVLRLAQKLDLHFLIKIFTFICVDSV